MWKNCGKAKALRMQMTYEVIYDNQRARKNKRCRGGPAEFQNHIPSTQISFSCRKR